MRSPDMPEHRGGVRATNYVLHIPCNHAITWCGRRMILVNCTPDDSPDVSTVEGDAQGHAYAREEICKSCYRASDKAAVAAARR